MKGVAQTSHQNTFTKDPEHFLSTARHGLWTNYSITYLYAFELALLKMVNPTFSN